MPGSALSPMGECPPVRHSRVVTSTASHTGSRTTAPGPVGPLWAFVRFVLCGGGIGLLSSGALLVASGRLPLAVANAVVSVVSTVLATELHGRFTFRGARPGRREHLQSALTAAAGYLCTTGALLCLHALLPAASALLVQAVYLGASALAGVARFAVLRLVVFAPAAARPAPEAGPVRLRRGSVMAVA